MTKTTRLWIEMIREGASGTRLPPLKSMRKTPTPWNGANAINWHQIALEQLERIKELETEVARLKKADMCTYASKNRWLRGENAKLEEALLEIANGVECGCCAPGDPHCEVGTARDAIEWWVVKEEPHERNRSAAKKVAKHGRRS